MSGLEVRARDRLREFELEVELEVDGRTAAWRWSGRRAPARRPCCASSPGCSAPIADGSLIGERVWLDTEPRDRPAARSERRCGYLFQDYALFPHLSAWRNVAFGLHELPRRERRGRALELLERFGVEELADARPRDALGRRAPAGRAGAGAGARPERPAARRAAGRARLPHRARTPARELGDALREAPAPAIARHPRLRRGGAARRRDRGHRRGTDRPARHRRGALGATRVAPSSPTSPARWCSTGTARPARRGLTLVDLDGGGVAAQHRPDPRSGRRPRLSVGDQRSSPGEAAHGARRSTASRSRSSR